MKMMQFILLVVCLMMISAACYGEITPGDHTFSVQSGGVTRNYMLHVPPKSNNEGAPLPAVMVLHGAGSSAMGSSRHYGWREKADKEGFVAIFPEATPLHQGDASFRWNPKVWNDGSGRGFTEKHPIDDIAYLRAVLDDVIAKVKLDVKKIYCTGFSNGASMCFRAGVELSDRFAAIAPVSGHLWLTSPKPERPISMMLIAGTADPINPIDGGPAKNPWQHTAEMKPAMIDSVKAWVKLIGAPEEPAMVEEHGIVKTFHYGPGKGDCVAIFIVITGQGHEWPGTPRVLAEKLSGKSVTSINATDVIWSFFKGT